MCHWLLLLIYHEMADTACLSISKKAIIHRRAYKSEETVVSVEEMQLVTVTLH